MFTLCPPGHSIYVGSRPESVELPGLTPATPPTPSWDDSRLQLAGAVGITQELEWEVQGVVSLIAWQCLPFNTPALTCYRGEEQWVPAETADADPWSGPQCR